MLHFGDAPATQSGMTFNCLDDPLTYLATRRSGRAADLAAPGPDAGQLDAILKIAARTPDHGRRVPYRFIVVESEARQQLADLFARALFDSDPGAHQAKVRKTMERAHAAPTLVILLSSPIAGDKIPVWEQELTCGAVGMNLLHAVHAHGFAGCWITGWLAYDPIVQSTFCKAGERIAGLFYIGTPGTPLEERARPQIDDIVTRWNG